MNDQDKKILELYLKDVRKKKIIFLTIVVSIITSVLLYGLYEKYKNLADKQNKVIFGGRLGEYKYYDMDKVIAAALEQLDRIV